MTQLRLFASPNEIEIGCRVRVSKTGSHHYNRTARVEALILPSEDQNYIESRHSWQVVFDWPMGGVSGRDIFQEIDLQIIPRI